MSSEPRIFDVIVVGSGQGGNPLAKALARAGRRVALIERKHVGGTCVNVGCTPTKTMVASAEIAHLARRAGEYGVDVVDVTVDMKRVRSRTREVVASFRDGSRGSMESTENLELVFGDARMTGPRRLAVETTGGLAVFEAETIVLNPGQRPHVPPIDGLASTPFLTNETLIEIDRVPEHLVVLGGGYVGLEFGQMFRRFGADVTIVQRSEQITTREDRDVAAALAEILREDGIGILASAEAISIAPADGGVRIELDRDGAPDAVSGSHLLVATGRTPNTGGLGLEAAGIETDKRGHIRVDEHLRTTAAGVYAIGDVTGGAAFTHVSYDDFRILESHLIGDGSRSTRDRVIPYVLYTDPQLGRVGLTEAQASEQGGRVGVAKMPASKAARGIETGRTRGLWKAVVDLDSGRILGAAILDAQGGEIASLLQVAMMGDLPYTALRDGMFAHPTYAESLNNLFASVHEAG